MRPIAVVSTAGCIWLGSAAVAAQTESPPASAPSAPAPAEAAPPAAPPAAYGQPPAYPPPPGYPYPPPGYPPPGYPPAGYGAPPPEALQEAPAAGWDLKDTGFILALDRIVTLHGTTFASRSGNSESGVTFNLAGNAGITGVVNPIAAPMLSGHGVVAGGLTLGTGLGYVTGSTGSSSNDHWSAVNFAPRIGYLAKLGEKSAFWPKAGMTLTQINIGDNDGITLVDISVDPTFAVFPIPHVAVLLGLMVDIGVSSTESSGSSSHDSTKVTDYGFAAGLAAFF